MHSVIFKHVFDIVCVDKRIVDGNNLDEKIVEGHRSNISKRAHESPSNGKGERRKAVLLTSTSGCC
jgi:hypothetical protein